MLPLASDAKYFRVLIEGRNLLLKDFDTSKVERLGFYTTRFVKASDSATAANSAMAIAAADIEKAEPLNEPSHGPTMEAIEVEEVPRDVVEQVKGFTFFPDEIN